ncbi:MAG: ribosomal protein S18-alanine N-acetyltransferase [Bacillota bacterium]
MVAEKLDFKVRRMFLHEVEDIYNIEKQSFDGAMWPLSAFIEEAAEEMAIYFVATLDGKIIGYSGFWVIIDEIHLNNIAVLPQFRRRGIAKALLLKTIEYGVGRLAEKMTLEVSDKNVAAVELYRSFGFIEEGLRTNYYAPGEHALIMWLYQLSDISLQETGETSD